MVLLPIEKVPLGISTTWYFYLMVLLPIDRVISEGRSFKVGILQADGGNFYIDSFKIQA